MSATGEKATRLLVFDVTRVITEQVDVAPVHKFAVSRLTGDFVQDVVSDKFGH